MQDIPVALQQEFEKKLSFPERIFDYYGLLDLPQDVIRWAEIKRNASAITSSNITISVSHFGSGDWKEILESAALAAPFFISWSFGGRDPCLFKIGYTTIGFLTLFTGFLDQVKFDKKFQVSLTFRDRFAAYTSFRIGSSQSPADYYSASSYTVFGDSDWSSGRNPADIVWHILTFWGGLDSTESAANTDIDWDAFQVYRDFLGSLALLTQAKFEGEIISTALRDIAELTLSTFFSNEDGKIICRVFLGQNIEDIQSYDRSNLIGIPNIEVRKESIINQYRIYYGYNPLLETFLGSVFREDTTYQDYYGERISTFDKTNVWLFDSFSATSVAERLIEKTANWPERKVKIESLLFAWRHEPWDAIRISESEYSLVDAGCRIESLSWNMGTGRVKMEGTLTELYDFLVLDDPVKGEIDSIYVLA